MPANVSAVRRPAQIARDNQPRSEVSTSRRRVARPEHEIRLLLRPRCSPACTSTTLSSTFCQFLGPVLVLPWSRVSSPAATAARSALSPQVVLATFWHDTTGEVS